MGQLIVRGLDESIIRALKQRAIRAGRSTEAEHREILERALAHEVEEFAVLAARLRAEGPRQITDSADIIRQDRDRDHLGPQAYLGPQE